MSRADHQSDPQPHDEACLQEGDLLEPDALAKVVLEARILVVDDQRSARELIRMSLESAGYRNLQYASDGNEALIQIAEEPPDLVVLDLLMPTMDGYEFCAKLREDPNYRDTPVLVQSSIEGARARGKVFEVGASDIVSKPIERIEFLSRVRTHLERYCLIKELRSYYRSMEQEMDAMQDMQRCMLPDDEYMANLTNAPGLTIDASYQASSRLGGDLWGALKLTDHSFAIYLLDFNGRGAASSLNTFRLKAFVDSGAFDQDSSSDTLEKINQYLVSTLATGTFATMFYGVVDTMKCRLSWSASGCPPPLLVSGNGSTTELETAGLPSGIANFAEYEEMTVPFSPGDRLFLFSDGLVECPLPDKPVLTSNDVVKLITSPALGDATEMVVSVVNGLRERHQASIPDDVTLLALDWSKAE